MQPERVSRTHIISESLALAAARSVSRRRESRARLVRACRHMLCVSQFMYPALVPQPPGTGHGTAKLDDCLPALCVAP